MDVNFSAALRPRDNIVVIGADGCLPKKSEINCLHRGLFAVPGSIKRITSPHVEKYEFVARLTSDTSTPEEFSCQLQFNSN